jgi:hypothetical protein
LKGAALLDKKGQILALDEFHHESVRLDPVNRSDVRMIERREHLRFTFEPRDTVGVSRKTFGQNLQRDIAVEVRVFRAIDLAHSSFAKLGEDAIWPECLADLDHLASLASEDAPKLASRA